MRADYKAGEHRGRQDLFRLLGLFRQGGDGVKTHISEDRHRGSAQDRATLPGTRIIKWVGKEAGLSVRMVQHINCRRHQENYHHAANTAREELIDLGRSLDCLHIQERDRGRENDRPCGIR